MQTFSAFHHFHCAKHIGRLRAIRNLISIRASLSNGRKLSIDWWYRNYKMQQFSGLVASILSFLEHANRHGFITNFALVLGQKWKFYENCVCTCLRLIEQPLPASEAVSRRSTTVFVRNAEKLTWKSRMRLAMIRVRLGRRAFRNVQSGMTVAIEFRCKKSTRKYRIILFAWLSLHGSPVCISEAVFAPVLCATNRSKNLLKIISLELAAARRNQTP